MLDNLANVDIVLTVIEFVLMLFHVLLGKVVIIRALL